MAGLCRTLSLRGGFAPLGRLSVAEVIPAVLFLRIVVGSARDSSIDSGEQLRILPGSTFPIL
jgi:hypothetical protein